jgi:acyl-coenzyme A thioesterase PaaI-like protein
LGYDVTEAERGRVVTEPTDKHLNPAGTVHGGLAAILPIVAWGWRSIGQTTLEFKVSLVWPITPETGLIPAEGVVLSRGRRADDGKITDNKGRRTRHF